MSPSRCATGGSGRMPPLEWIPGCSRAFATRFTAAGPRGSVHRCWERSHIQVVHKGVIDAFRTSTARRPQRARRRRRDDGLHPRHAVARFGGDGLRSRLHGQRLGERLHRQPHPEEPRDGTAVRLADQLRLHREPAAPAGLERHLGPDGQDGHRHPGGLERHRRPRLVDHRRGQLRLQRHQHRAGCRSASTARRAAARHPRRRPRRRRPSPPPRHRPGARPRCTSPATGWPTPRARRSPCAG